MSLSVRLSGLDECVCTIKWAWSHLRGARALTALSAACVVASSGAVVAAPMLLKWLIDSLLPQKQWAPSGFAVLLWSLAIIGRIVFDAVAEYSKQCAIQKCEFLVRARAFAQVYKLPAAFHDAHPAGDLHYRLDNDVARFASSSIELATETVRFASVVGMTVGMVLGMVDWKLAVGLAPVMAIFVVLQLRPHSAGLRQSLDAALARRADLSAFLQESLAAVLQVQILRRERSRTARAARFSNRAARTAIRAKRSEILLSVTSMMVWAVATAIGFAYGVWQVQRGALSIGGLVLVYWLVFRLFEPLNQIGGLLIRWQAVRATGSRVREILDAAPLTQIQPTAPHAEAGKSAGPFIQIRQVVFSYPHGSGPALRGVDLDVRQGERVAIIGPSGSGKSTLAKLLARIYDPDEGDIRIDGKDIREYHPSELRSLVGLLPQDFALFRGTVRENLLDGNPAALPGDLMLAVDAAQLSEELDAAPGGLDYMLGALGSGLSTGQRQRLALARELLASRRIVILDESTSALDAGTEHRLLDALEEYLTDQTVIVVSHRPAPAHWAGRVIVLKEGSIVQDQSRDSNGGLASVSVFCHSGYELSAPQDGAITGAG